MYLLTWQLKTNPHATSENKIESKRKEKVEAEQKESGKIS